MFSQVDTGGSRAEGGLGIGLALVKGLTDLHGGTVDVKSGGLGCGSEFTIRLPVAVGDVPVPTTNKADAVPQPMGQRILVADDNRDAAESPGMLLESLGL